MGASLARQARAQPSGNRGIFNLPVRQGAPARLTVNLPYEYSQRVAPGVVTAVDQIFMINNLNDLNFSAAGNNQARGYDQWANFYERYRVNYVQAKFYVRQRQAHGLRVYAVLNSSNTDVSTDSRVGEMERAVMLGITGSSQPAIQTTRIFYPGSALGMTSTQYQNDETTAAGIGAAPTALAYLHLVGAQVDLTLAADFEFCVELNVNVTFFDRVTIGAS